MPGDIMGIEHHRLMLEGLPREMTKDEALAAWDEAADRLEEVKARHKRELTLAKEEFAKARDAFIDADARSRSPLTSNQRGPD